MDPLEIASTLARTPGTLRALTAGLPAEWLHRNDGPGTWSAYDVVGHLLNAEETNWLPRTRMILQHGPDRAFEPFDREAMLRWEPEPIDGILDRFQAVREAIVEELLALRLSTSDLDRRGLHPEVGEVTLAVIGTQSDLGARLCRPSTESPKPSSQLNSRRGSAAGCEKVKVPPRARARRLADPEWERIEAALIGCSTTGDVVDVRGGVPSRSSPGGRIRSY